jgi:RimJ/RimL family protein N-acetyltransferase
MVGTILAGEKTTLRPLRDDDLPRRVEWLNDPETFRLLTGYTPTRPVCMIDARRWRRVLEADECAVVFAIESDAGQHIGDVDLHGIDLPSKWAKLTILIGDKAHWGRGYGADALRTLLGYAFSEMRLETIMLRVFTFNTRAVRCYEKCGFLKTGVRSRSPTLLGVPEVHMSLTRESFEAAISEQALRRAA